MRPRALFPLAALVLVTGLATATQASPSEARVTRDDTAGSYTLAGGGTDATMTACSTGRRSQNEPAIAVDPHNTDVVVAGSNDYCAQIVNGDVWVGYYRSTDGGTTWTNSLVPGYPKDTSAAGLASPTHGVCGVAGDPTEAFDSQGLLFYGFICFNRSNPQDGSIYVAAYGDHGATYVRTVRVARGVGGGLFQDKINVVTDQSNGNVYVAWAQYTGLSNNNQLLFSRSTDHGQTFSPPIRVTQRLSEEQFADMAVGPDHSVYITFRTIAHQVPTRDTIWLLRSTDMGQSFGAPRLVATITPFDGDQFSGNGSGDCGDGPFACPSGLTYSRFDSLSAVAADTTGVHVVWSARLLGGQAKIFVRNSPDGVSFPTPAAALDTVPLGHQWFPDIASAGGTISVVFYDSRTDLSYSPDRPPGNTATGTNSGDVVNAFIAKSTDGGRTWTETQLTSHGSNFGWETHGARRVGFWGDYIYVSAAGGAVNVVWTDSRDLVPGDDPRETGADDDHDGFDVYQPCKYKPNDINASTYESPTIDDPCLSMGGLDQNVYAARV